MRSKGSGDPSEPRNLATGLKGGSVNVKPIYEKNSIEQGSGKRESGSVTQFSEVQLL